jgi:hypothetical protein
MSIYYFVGRGLAAPLPLFCVETNFEAATELAITNVIHAIESTIQKVVEQLNPDKGDDTCNADELVNLIAVVVNAVNLNAEVLVNRLRCVIQNA